MQFAVPQFTEIEDRLIGSLTLKQFFVLLGTGGLVLFFWSILGPSFIFFILATPIAVVGTAAALGKHNGRPMFIYLIPLAAFITSTKVRVFKRETPSVSISKAEVKQENKTAVNLEPTESRLKKLAYLMDSKIAEEKDILNNDQMHAIEKNKPLPRMPKIDIKSAIHKAVANIEPDSVKKKEPENFDPNSLLKNG